MQRLSSAFTPRAARRLLLALWALILLGLATWGIARWLGYSHNLWPAFVPLMCGVLVMQMGLVAQAPFVKGVLDEAWLDGDELLLRRRNQSARVPLADVAEIDTENARLIALSLRVPCILGDPIRFAVRSRNARTTSADLRERARAATPATP